MRRSGKNDGLVGAGGPKRPHAHRALYGTTMSGITTYCVYLLECSDGSYYCGIAADMDRRLRQHNAGSASRYTRGRTPVKVLAVSRVCYSRSVAQQLERRIKKCPKRKKLSMLTMLTRAADRRP